MYIYIYIYIIKNRFYLAQTHVFGKKCSPCSPSKRFPGKQIGVSFTHSNKKLLVFSPVYSYSAPLLRLLVWSDAE